MRLSVRSRLPTDWRHLNEEAQPFDRSARRARPDSVRCSDGADGLRRKTITHQAKPATDDANITTRVKTALLNDPDIVGQIDVDTADGVVTLSGAVKTAAERDKAIALARKVTGVSDVKSTLQVQ